MTAGAEGWVHAGGGRRAFYGSSECGGVDGHITRDTWSTRTQKRCFQVWLYWRSTLTFTQWWKKRAKRGRRWDENIATVVRKWKNKVAKWRGGMALHGKSCPQDSKREEATRWIHMNIAWFEHRRAAERMVWWGSIQEDMVQLVTPCG